MRTPESLLFTAVVVQAFQDAANPRVGGEALRDREAAREWLLTRGRDFDATCVYAGLNPGYVRSEARRHAAAGWQPIRLPEAA